MFKKIITPTINSKLLSKRSLLYVILFLLAFNILTYLFTSLTTYPKVQRRKDAVGLSHEKAQKFLYFYYYKGLFPLITLNENVDYSEKGADLQIENFPDSLLMEYKHWARLGESARIFVYYPNAFVKGSPENPSVKLFNALFLFLALSFSYWGFWRAGKPLFGLIVVLLTNFSPFFLFEIYSNQNIFGLLGSLFVLAIGLNARWLLNSKLSWVDYVLIPIITGALIAFTAQIRNEVVIVIVSGLLIYLLTSQKRFLLRFIPIAVLLMSYLLVTSQVKQYFHNKFNTTLEFVEKVGGNPYNGDRIEGHMFWHPVFCGLGDFDYKYGYEWNDIVAYKYAVPVLKEKYGIDIPYNDDFHTNLYYDSARHYYKKFDEIPQYEEVVRDKVLSDIQNDPLWFLYILFMRILMVLTVTQPFPLLGWFALWVIYVLWKEKQWDFLKLLIVAMPLSATSIIIFAAKGTTYNSMFPLISLAIFLYLQTHFDKYLYRVPIVKKWYVKKRNGSE